MLFRSFCSEILRKAFFLEVESHRNFLRVGEPATTRLVASIGARGGGGGGATGLLNEGGGSNRLPV